MNKMIVANLIIMLSYPTQGYSQPMKIPVIPYYKRRSPVPTRIHNKCKSTVNYSNCVKRYLRIY